MLDARPHPFDLLVQRDPVEIRLGEAALLFARDHCPDLKVGYWLMRLDGLARRVDRLGARTTGDRVDALRTVLVGQEGLAGNKSDYYDPRNSFLNTVLERGLGIPISLSAVWLDVAGQLGWPLAGVGLPGHYVLAYQACGEEILIDAFDEGEVLTRDDCHDRVTLATGHAAGLTEAHFRPVSILETLSRMLNNLRLVFLQRRHWYGAACVLDRMLALHPDGVALQQQHRAVVAELARRN